MHVIALVVIIAAAVTTLAVAAGNQAREKLVPVRIRRRGD